MRRLSVRLSVDRFAGIKGLLDIASFISNVDDISVLPGKGNIGNSPTPAQIKLNPENPVVDNRISVLYPHLRGDRAGQDANEKKAEKEPHGFNHNTKIPAVP